MKDKIITLLTIIAPCIAFAEEASSKLSDTVATIPLIAAVIALLIFIKPNWFIAKAIIRFLRFCIASHPVKCRNCGYTSRGEAICPNCGADLSDSDPHCAFLTGVGTFVFFIFRLVVFAILEISVAIIALTLAAEYAV